MHEESLQKSQGGTPVAGSCATGIDTHSGNAITNVQTSPVDQLLMDRARALVEEIKGLEEELLIERDLINHQRQELDQLGRKLD
jgi:hypothetical protein